MAREQGEARRLPSKRARAAIVLTTQSYHLPIKSWRPHAEGRCSSSFVHRHSFMPGG